MSDVLITEERPEAAPRPRNANWDVVISNYHPSWSGHAAKGLQREGYSVLSLGSLRRAQPGDEYRFSKSAWALRHLARFSPCCEEAILGAARRRMDVYAGGRSCEGRLFWGWSGFSSRGLKRCRARSVPTILDTGSSHIRWSERRHLEEFERENLGGFSAAQRAQHDRTFEEYAGADVICVPSQYVRDTFLEYGVAEEKVYLNAYGVDSNLWRGIAEERARKRPDGPFIFVFAGSVTLRKGIAHLLRAWEALGEVDAELWLVGGVFPDCRERMGRLPRGVKLLGFQSWEDLGELYQKADVYVLPSLEEGMARSVLEAMAAGLPVIVTWETGTTEVMVDGEDGWVVEAANAEALANAMRTAIEERGRLRAMGQSARERVKDYTWEAYGKRAASLARRFLG